MSKLDNLIFELCRLASICSNMFNLANMLVPLFLFHCICLQAQSHVSQERESNETYSSPYNNSLDKQAYLKKFHLMLFSRKIKASVSFHYFFFGKVRGSNFRYTEMTWNYWQYAQVGLLRINLGTFHQSNEVQLLTGDKNCSNTVSHSGNYQAMSFFKIKTRFHWMW